MEVPPAGEVHGAAVCYEAVVANLAGRRAGTASTRTRAEVHGTTRKFYRQKGTGRARQGSRTAPHWKGGGSVFGPRPRSYRMRLPRKVRRLALRSAFSESVQSGKVKVVEDIALDRPRSKDLVGILDALRVGREVLIVAEEIGENLEKSARNVRGVELLRVEGLNAYLVMRHPHILFTRKGLEKFFAFAAFGEAGREQSG